MRRFYIHAGLPKTGTSYLQSVFFGSREALVNQDFVLLPERRPDHLNLALDLRRMVAAFDPDEARTATERFRREVTASSAGRALLTQEALAPLTPGHGADLMDALYDFEVHLLLTIRDPGRQLPSAWQQRIQGRRTYDFAEFLEDLVSRGRLTRDLWANQDVGRILDNWSQLVDPSRIHIITGPPPGAPPDTLLERFCSVVDLPPGILDASAPTTNIALGQAQAEVLRRVNIALGDRFPHSRDGYARLGRTYLAGQVLQRQSGRAARLPSVMRPWADDLVDGWIAQIRAGGFDVVGDLDELRNRDSSFEDQPTTYSEGELLEVAAAALADVLELRNEELEAHAAEVRRLRRRIARLRRQGGD